MSAATRFCSVLLVFAAAAAAQQTYIVDWQNAPGTHFTDLPPALAAVTHGDTIVMKSGGYSSGATDKGIAIVADGSVSLRTHPQQFAVFNLPAGRTFRMAGIYSPRNEPFFLRVDSCQGDVLLDDLHGVEHGLYPITRPSFVITDCAFVSMHECDNFGYPVVDVRRSIVSMTRCTFGITSIQIGGGNPLVAESSTVYVTEPFFDGVLGSGPAIQLTNSDLVLTGTTNSYVQGAHFMQPQSAPAISAQGGRIVIDPNVRLNPFKAGPQAIVGTATVVTKTVPGAYVVGTAPGLALQTSLIAPTGTPVLAALSTPVAPTATPFGALFLDIPSTVVFASGNVPAGGLFTTILSVPPSVPPGVALTLQGVAVLGGRVELSTGCVFVAHE